MVMGIFSPISFGVRRLVYPEPRRAAAFEADALPEKLDGSANTSVISQAQKRQQATALQKFLWFDLQRGNSCGTAELLQRGVAAAGGKRPAPAGGTQPLR